MNERTKKLAIIANPSSQEIYESDSWQFNCAAWSADDLEKFAELIVQECIDKIETYRIPVGNSPAGELACEWTYGALEDIRDDIKETFGIQ